MFIPFFKTPKGASSDISPSKDEYTLTDKENKHRRKGPGSRMILSSAQKEAAIVTKLANSA
jgi:hypothetical protein